MSNNLPLNNAIENLQTLYQDDDGEEVSAELFSQLVGIAQNLDRVHCSICGLGGHKAG